MLFRVHRTPSTALKHTVHLVRKKLSTSHVTAATQLPRRLTVNEKDIEEAFLKGSGPGGQKINKTSSAVQLKHVPTGIVVKSQATRSRSQNRKIARQNLAEKIEELEKGPESRTALKAEIKRKQKASKSKKARRKYRALQDNRAVEVDEEEGTDLENRMEDEAREERV
ncbi:hypothetical protein JMJ35_004589 [Cladonia borealis]|uniref:Prokaryotic-type class I peptide chain release factors domain-containing protein n=1 Tax=Cladonia borealis TaxID=184061 RepID=A0AA39R0B0_9LECA|nr:hypothetical protein JMJ35_004589 [Cladonia borealis]